PEVEYRMVPPIGLLEGSAVSLPRNIMGPVPPPKLGLAPRKGRPGGSKPDRTLALLSRIWEARALWLAALRRSKAMSVDAVFEISHKNRVQGPPLCPMAVALANHVPELLTVTLSTLALRM